MSICMNSKYQNGNNTVYISKVFSKDVMLTLLVKVLILLKFNNIFYIGRKDYLSLSYKYSFIKISFRYTQVSTHL
jgi:hypothetical protein